MLRAGSKLLWLVKHAAFLFLEQRFLSAFPRLCLQRKMLWKWGSRAWVSHTLQQLRALFVLWYKKKKSFQIAVSLAISATKMQATWRGFYRRKKFLHMKHSGMREKGNCSAVSLRGLKWPLLWVRSQRRVGLDEPEGTSPKPCWKQNGRCKVCSSGSFHIIPWDSKRT